MLLLSYETGVADKGFVIDELRRNLGEWLTTAGQVCP
jgi:hypothetical protein